MTTRTTKKKVTKKATKKVAKKKTVNKVGRPTKYDPAFCEIAINALKEGYSKEAVAGHIGICKDTLYRWCKEHKDFSDAINIGLEYSRLHWEGLAMKHITHTKASKKLDSTVWIFNMKNRFNWADKTEVKQEDTTNKTKKTFAFDLSEEPQK